MQKFFLDQDEYLLTDAEARQVDEKDKECPPTDEGNTAFNKFFRDFVRDHWIRPINKRMARYWTKATNTTDETVKMAITQRAMRSILSVMDPEHILTATFDNEAPTSAWVGSRVILPTAPIKKSADLHEAINVEGGFAIHEACHSKYTRPLITTEVKAFIKNPINMALANLLEDERIEAEEMKENPGYRSYLNTTSDWLWVEDKEGESISTEWPEETGAKLNAAIAAVRYTEKAASKQVAYADKVLQIKAISDEYRDNPKSDLIFATTRLRTLMEIGDDEGEPKGEGAAGGPPPPGSKLSMCEFVHGDATVSPEVSKAVSDLVDQEVEQLDPKKDSRFMSEGMDAPTMTVMRKPLGAGSKRPKIDDLLAKAKAAITLRRAIPRADERHMLSGELDEDELYRLFANDARVFRDITEEVVPSATVYLLIDMSGSMGGSIYTSGSAWTSKIETAEKLAFLFVSALRSFPNVNVRVLGHTGDNADSGYDTSSGYDRSGRAVFYRIWEEGDSLERLSIITQTSMGENYDSFAIAWAGNMLDAEEADQKLIIVLSDGQPAGRKYGGNSAMDHVRKQVDRLVKRGIDTVQIAIDDSLSGYDQKRMFRHYVPMNGAGGYSTMIRNLQKILEKVATR